MPAGDAAAEPATGQEPEVHMIELLMFSAVMMGNKRFDKYTYLGRFVARRQDGERGRGILLIFDS